jgi:MFS family permease
MTVMSPIFGVLGNRWSLKWLLVFGTIGYVPYSAALYCNSVYGTQWFLLFGAATCGFSACPTSPNYAAFPFADV